MSRVAGRIRALNFCRTVIFGRRTAIALLSLAARIGQHCQFQKAGRSGVAGVSARPSLRGTGEHHHTQCQYRQSHELEYQSVKHNNSPIKPIDLVGRD
jgi:hypothetical protein